MNRQPALTQAQQRRLQKLAREAGRTPQSMLRFVLQGGFEYCDYLVQSANEGIKSLDRVSDRGTHEVLDTDQAH